MPDRPKIALVGGPDVNLRLDMMRHLAPRYDVFAVGSNRDHIPEFEAAGFTYLVYKLSQSVNPISDAVSVRQLVKVFKREKPDLVHTFSTKPCLVGRFAARLAGVPAIVGTMPGLGTLYASELGEGKRWHSLVRMVYEPSQKLASRISDVTVLQNRDDAELVVAKRIVPEAKMRIIAGSGVNVHEYDRTTIDQAVINRTRAEIGIASDEVVVTMVSRLVRAKGVLDFARAAQILSKMGRGNVRLLLVGPWDRANSDALSSDEVKGMQEHVTWIGARSDLPVLYAMSDIFALPSFYREGIPRVLMEAAATGLPLITTNMPGCREVVEDGRNGFLIAPKDAQALADAIIRLADDPDLRSRFGGVSRQMAVSRFDSVTIHAQIEDVYESLLAHDRQ